MKINIERELFSAGKNLVISVTGRGANKDFSILITDHIPDLNLVAISQCFPMYIFEERKLNETEQKLWDFIETDLNNRNQKIIEVTNGSGKAKSQILKRGGYVYQLAYLEALANIADSMGFVDLANRADRLISTAVTRGSLRGMNGLTPKEI